MDWQRSTDSDGYPTKIEFFVRCTKKGAGGVNGVTQWSQ